MELHVGGLRLLRRHDVCTPDVPTEDAVLFTAHLMVPARSDCSLQHHSDRDYGRVRRCQRDRRRKSTAVS